MKKRRSDFSKLMTRAREVWRQSVVYQEVKKKAKDPNRSGWFLCTLCGMSREVIKNDHIDGIGTQPKTWLDFGPWLAKLFGPAESLQPLCQDCHNKKTKLENKIRRIKKKALASGPSMI